MSAVKNPHSSMRWEADGRWSDRDPRIRRRHADAFPGIGTRAALRRVDYRRSTEMNDESYPFTLITGRQLYAFNAGTMTSRSVTAALTGGPVLDISPGDAAALGLVEGDPVRICSRHGAATMPCRLDDGLPPATVFTTFGCPDVAVNALLGPGRDPTTHTPEYKMTAVHLTRELPAENARDTGESGRTLT